MARLNSAEIEVGPDGFLWAEVRSGSAGRSPVKRYLSSRAGEASNGSSLSSRRVRAATS